MFRATIHEAAGATTGFWHSNVTVPTLGPVSSTRWVFQATIAGGRFDGERISHVLLGSFNPARGTGRIAEERELVGGELHFSIRYESRVTLQNYEEDFAAAARDGVVMRGNSFANAGWGDVGDDRLSGGGGADTLIAYAGDDRLDGGAGRDRMRGGAGDDLYRVDNRGDRVAEKAGRGTDAVIATVSHALASSVEKLTLVGAAINGTGNGLDNVLRGNAGANVLNGRAGDDTISGRAGDDVLIGSRGGDRMAGGKGADTLVGGLGRDVMTGNAGADDFEFRSLGQAGLGAGRDVVRDFETGVDRLDLSALDADVQAAGDQAFVLVGALPFSGTAGELRQDGGIVAGDTDGDAAADFEVRIVGAVALAADDFVL